MDVVKCEMMRGTEGHEEKYLFAVLSLRGGVCIGCVHRLDYHSKWVYYDTAAYWLINAIRS